MPAVRRPWTREELLLTLNLYFRISFGRQHGRAPEVIALAKAIERTASAVAMKLNNFTSIDPEEKARGVSGLAGASHADRHLWNEFQEQQEELAAESEQLWLARVDHRPPERKRPADLAADFHGATEGSRSVTVRLAQGFFRKAVRSAYGHRCCVSGIAVPGLLIASHIVPWAEDEANRARPTNGLLLSSLHDAAFDRHLITFDEELRLVIGAPLSDHFTNSVVQESFGRFEGQPLRLPDRHTPDIRLMARHRARFAAAA
jgi:putative restriction endonuclease